MTAQLGRSVLLKYYNGSTYVTVGGARDITLTIANTPVDITNADDSGIRKLLQGAGDTSVSIKFGGVYIDDVARSAIRTAALTNAHNLFQVFVPGTVGHTYQGSFMIASYDEASTYNGAVTDSLTLESAGAVTLT
jgi:TP901-1 family phage major tail protein